MMRLNYGPTFVSEQQVQNKNYEKTTNAFGDECNDP